MCLVSFLSQTSIRTIIRSRSPPPVPDNGSAIYLSDEMWDVTCKAEGMYHIAFSLLGVKTRESPALAEVVRFKMHSRGVGQVLL